MSIEISDERLEQQRIVESRTTRGIYVHQVSCILNPPKVGETEEDEGKLWSVFLVHKVAGGYFWYGERSCDTCGALESGHTWISADEFYDLDPEPQICNVGSKDPNRAFWVCFREPKPPEDPCDDAFMQEISTCES